MPNHYVDRDRWRDNPFGVSKDDYDNERDYMEAVQEALMDSDEDSDIAYSIYDDDYSFDEDEDN